MFSRTLGAWQGGQFGTCDEEGQHYTLHRWTWLLSQPPRPPLLPLLLLRLLMLLLLLAFRVW
jgi:hypothetical protein